MAVSTLMQWQYGNLSHCLKREMCLYNQNVRELVSVTEVPFYNYDLVSDICRPRKFQNELAPVLIFQLAVSKLQS